MLRYVVVVVYFLTRFIYFATRKIKNPKIKIGGKTKSARGK
jgi:hypothetical protein